MQRTFVVTYLSKLLEAEEQRFTATLETGSALLTESVPIDQRLPVLMTGKPRDLTGTARNWPAPTSPRRSS